MVTEELSKHPSYLSFRKEIPLETLYVDKNSLDQMKNRFPVLADGELAVLFVTLNFRNFSNEANSASAILDDKAARNVAKRLGVRYFGTLKLLSELLREGLMTKPEFKQYIKKLRDSGFYFNERLLIEIVGKDS
jgi:predicted nucleic acid-binding protein